MAGKEENVAEIVCTWLGHAAFRIEHNNFVLLIDPWLENPRAPKDLVLDKVDVILLTHGHFDHVGNTVDLVQKHKCKVVCIQEVQQYLVTQGVEKAQCVGMNKGGTIELGSGFKATMVNAVHSSSCGSDPTTNDGGSAAGFVINAPNGHTIYHSGDTDVFGDMKLISDLYRPDVAMLCIGGHYTMGPQGAAYAVNNLLMTVKIVIPKPSHLDNSAWQIPMSYGTFPNLTGTPADFHALITRKDANMTRLDPGEPLALDLRSVRDLF